MPMRLSPIETSIVLCGRLEERAFRYFDGYRELLARLYLHFAD